MHYEKTQTLGEKKKAAVGRSDAERHGGKEVTDYGEDGESLLRILKRIKCVDYCSRRAVPRSTIYFYCNRIMNEMVNKIKKSRSD